MCTLCMGAAVLKFLVASVSVLVIAGKDLCVSEEFEEHGKFGCSGYSSTDISDGAFERLPASINVVIDEDVKCGLGSTVFCGTSLTVVVSRRSREERSISQAKSDDRRGFAVSFEMLVASVESVLGGFRAICKGELSLKVKLFKGENILFGIKGNVIVCLSVLLKLSKVDTCKTLGLL